MKDAAHLQDFHAHNDLALQIVQCVKSSEYLIAGMLPSKGGHTGVAVQCTHD